MAKSASVWLQYDLLRTEKIGRHESIYMEVAFNTGSDPTYHGTGLTPNFLILSAVPNITMYFVCANARARLAM